MNWLKADKQTGFGQFEIGDEITTDAGNTIWIRNIIIDAGGLKPAVSIVYDFEKKDGKQGNSHASLEDFVNMIREKRED